MCLRTQSWPVVDSHIPLQSTSLLGLKGQSGERCWSIFSGPDTTRWGRCAGRGHGYCAPALCSCMRLLPTRDGTLAQGRGDFFLVWQVPKVVVIFSDELLISINLDWNLKAGDKWEWGVLLWAFQQINGQSWLKDGSTFSECNQVRCNPYCVAH